MKRFIVAAMCLALTGALAERAHAQSCDPHSNFDPASSTMMVAGYGVVPGWARFLSPENTDPDMVWHVGDPGTLDGCIGGVYPGSGLATGKLEIQIDYLFCFGIDVETVAPYTAELYDPQGGLVSSMTGNSPSVDLPFSSPTWSGYRLVLTPGLMAGGTRDALCVDNMRAVYGESPVAGRTWGRLKTLYR